MNNRGRRTKISVRKPVRKDENGLEDMDSFWAAAEQDSRLSTTSSSIVSELDYNTSSSISDSESEASYSTDTPQNRSRASRRTRSSVASMQTDLSPVHEEDFDGGETPPQLSQSGSRRGRGKESVGSVGSMNAYMSDLQYEGGVSGQFDDDEEDDTTPIAASKSERRSSLKGKSKRRLSSQNISFNQYDEVADLDSVGFDEAKSPSMMMMDEDEDEEEDEEDDRRLSTVSVRTEDMSFVKGTALPDETFVGEEEDEEEEEEGDSVLNSSTFNTSVDRSFIEEAKGRKEEDEEEELGEEDEDAVAHGLRRSRRATKGQKLNYWKNERFVYQGGELRGALLAPPTPHASVSKAKKAKKATGGSAKGKKGGSKTTFQGEELSLTEEEMALILSRRAREQKVSSSQLPPSRAYLSGEEMQIWNLVTNDVSAIKLAHFGHEDMFQLDPDSGSLTATPRKKGKKGKRPAPPTRLDSEDVRATSSKRQRKEGGSSSSSSSGRDILYFPSLSLPSVPETFSGFESGTVVVPPKCAKAPQVNMESLHLFYVLEGQQDGLEVAIAEGNDFNQEDEVQRLLLSEKDSFVLPPGNVYKIENHSETAAASLFWVKISRVTNEDMLEEEEG